MKTKTLTYLIVVVLGAAIVYYLSSNVIPRVLVSLTQAAPAQDVSLESSIIIGEKVLAKADGEDKVKVNVFIMDKSGKGIKGKNVELTGSMAGLPMNGLTEDDGKSGFELSSNNKGQFKLGANVEGIEMGKYITVTFN